jgi:hypothetical protein
MACLHLSMNIPMCMSINACICARQNVWIAKKDIAGHNQRVVLGYGCALYMMAESSTSIHTQHEKTFKHQACECLWVPRVWLRRYACRRVSMRWYVCMCEAVVCVYVRACVKFALRRVQQQTREYMQLHVPNTCPCMT